MTDDLRMSLKQTDDQMREENEHIAHGKAMIEKATAEGHDPTPYRKSVVAMRHFREALQHHRRILLERLGLYRP